MSIASITPASGGPLGDTAGAGAGTGRHRHVLGDALRAVKVFATAAFGVVVLGEYADEALVRHERATAIH
ncbi:hypothetical protein [Streptomyces sp. URMC 123]|uniref:hypothetical protein n=1 Tax=Streptomyces sp. URMC 123 TaxID=3423403 RepID=UPI003F1D9980